MFLFFFLFFFSFSFFGGAPELPGAVGSCAELGAGLHVSICEMGVCCPREGEDGEGPARAQGGHLGPGWVVASGRWARTPALRRGGRWGTVPDVGSFAPLFPPRPQQGGMHPLRQQPALPGLEVCARLQRGLLPRGHARAAAPSLPEVRARPPSFHLFLLITERTGEGEGERDINHERIMDGPPPARPALGIEPAPRACAPMESGSGTSRSIRPVPIRPREPLSPPCPPTGATRTV